MRRLEFVAAAEGSGDMRIATAALLCQGQHSTRCFVTEQSSERRGPLAMQIRLWYMAIKREVDGELAVFEKKPSAEAVSVFGGLALVIHSGAKTSAKFDVSQLIYAVFIPSCWLTCICLVI